MEHIMNIILVLHMLAGFIALTAGLIPFVTKKGGRTHRMMGKFFYYTMLIVSLSALTLSIYRFNPFLLMIGLLTGYSTITGYRGLILMRSQKYQGENQDWIGLKIFSIVFLLSFAVSFVWIHSHHRSFLPVLLIFATLLIIQIVEDARIFTGRKAFTKPHQWIIYHIGRISGAYIAALTGFLVNSIHTNPAFIGWILPAVAGLPIIFYYQKTYKEKKTAYKKASRIPQAMSK